MPQSNGRIYREIVSGSPTKGISLDDIAKGTGLRSSRDLGTLCQGIKDYETGHVGGVNDNPLYKDSNEYHGVIARWSKAKPVWFTGPQSFLAPDNGTDATLAAAWEARRKGNVDSPSGRTNPYITNNPVFKMVYGNEIPAGEKLFGTATGSGTFLDSSGKFTINQATADYNQVISDGGWLCGLLFDGQRIIMTDVVTLRWRYNPPLSGNGAVFHALDFDGYNRKAVNPMPKLERDAVIGVTFTGGDTPTAISIPITAAFPSVPDGNITFAELNDAIKERGYFGTNVGLADMYLCALVYHTEWAGGDNNVKIDQCLWGSSSKKFSESQNEGWNRITLSLPSSVMSGLNLSTLKDLLLNGTSNDEINGLREWKVKLFWCSAKISKTNDQPRDGSNNVLSSYKLVRGNDDVVGGTPVRFVDADNTSEVFPYVMITNPIQATTNEDGTKNYYATFVIYNPTSNAITFSKVWLAAYLDDDHTSPILEHPLSDNNTYPSSGSNATVTIPGQGGSHVVTLALENQQADDDYTDFLFYAKYGNGVDNVCGALIRVGGLSETFGEGDVYGRRWSDYSGEYTKPTNG